ncbi:hypothetical protein K438DRAFT_1827338 [Mycena galopus ATCC 62051]|nr:hypothetical protein K438DRAFT_1827338 [Mycena galopus ATCC 62051]
MHPSKIMCLDHRIPSRPAHHSHAGYLLLLTVAAKFAHADYTRPQAGWSTTISGIEQNGIIGVVGARHIVDVCSRYVAYCPHIPRPTRYFSRWP